MNGHDESWYSLLMPVQDQIERARGLFRRAEALERAGFLETARFARSRARRILRDLAPSIAARCLHPDAA